MLHLAILWHMHQPYYVDATPTESGGQATALMPWVRLHAVKGYLDMVSLAEQFPDLRLTFNLTPVLVRQILEFNDNATLDLWEHWTRKPAAELGPDEKKGILSNFFSAHPEHMVRPYPRYAQLLARRGPRVTDADLTHVLSYFNAQDFRDIQVWFNLTWCGHAACDLFPELSELKRKGRDFTEADKQLVVQRHRDIMRLVLGRYRALADSGRAELTTSPFFHPILPLVADSDCARRNLPHAPLPGRFACPEDALAQLQRARAQHEMVFGRPPKGLWPSEGSVSPEIMPLLREAGFQWFVTDEEILYRSSHMEGIERRGELALFRPYRAETQPGRELSINAFFRDRGISDFIGFVASRNAAQQSADFVVDNLRRIAEAARDANALVTVALDGENAWEHFPDGGREFLQRLYTAVTTDPHLKTTTFSDYLSQHPPKHTLHALHTGSWINADFHIWIGSAEKNRAWDLLGQTRRAYQHRIDRGGVSDANREAALDAIYAAEGSDWFWWYGDDFASEHKDIFDALFRSHLRRVYLKLGLPVPTALQVPIRRALAAFTIQPPRVLIEPVLDGRVTSFFEWYQAGHFDPGKAQSAMYRTERIVKNLYFGFDLEHLFFRVDFTVPVSSMTPSHSLRFCFERIADDETIATPVCVAVPELRPTENAVAMTDAANEPSALGASYAVRDILEVKVPTKTAGFKPGEHINFFFQVFTAGIETERYPAVGTLPLTLPDEDFEARNWSA
jgi:alpha-amylase/alpha-mannosidase (GH57 family)